MPAWPCRAVPDLPILIEHGGRAGYGLPVPGAPLYKTGLHHGGPAADPDQQDQDQDPGLTTDLAGFLRRCLPGLASSPVSFERCVYDNSPDEDFVIGRIGNVIIGSGTSGHGFKFGPLLGDWLAALATRETVAAEIPAGRRRRRSRGQARGCLALLLGGGQDQSRRPPPFSPRPGPRFGRATDSAGRGVLVATADQRQRAGTAGRPSRPLRALGDRRPGTRQAASALAPQRASSAQPRQYQQRSIGRSPPALAGGCAVLNNAGDNRTRR